MMKKLKNETMKKLKNEITKKLKNQITKKLKNAKVFQSRIQLILGIGMLKEIRKTGFRFYSKIQFYTFGK